MNGQIQKLAEQARAYARYYVAECKHHGYYMEHNELEVRFEKKFAELIVRECVIRAEREWIRNGSDTEHNKAITGVIKSIKEHFGVEE